MSVLRFFSAGESHGNAITGIIEGIPSGMSLSPEDINSDLVRRQKGYGRGGRMKIESDRVEILSGIRWGMTTGSPVTIMIKNKDWANWGKGMSLYANDKDAIPPVTRPRPGHADLAGAIKYNHRDIRNVLERSSARETAIRVAFGGIVKKFLSLFNIKIGSFVVQIGEIKVNKTKNTTYDELFKKAEQSDVRCFDQEASMRMKEEIDIAKDSGDSLGGLFEVFAEGLPPGLGSFIQWDRRIDGKLAQAIMSIQAIKGVEIGGGFEIARRFGSEAMDEIFYDSKHFPYFYRMTNNAGGVEGGMTNGMTLIIKGAMKPIPTLRKPLRSIDMVTKKPIQAAYERSDVCAVASAAIIGEAMTALVLTEAFLEKFSGDSMEEVKRNYDAYLKYLKEF